MTTTEWVQSNMFLRRGRQMLHCGSFFADSFTDIDRQYVLDETRRLGGDTICPWLFNNDPSCRVTPFVNGVFGGKYDPKKVNSWGRWIIGMTEAGFNFVPYIFCDGAISERRQFIPMASVFNDIASAINPYAKGIMLGLETSEYWSRAETEELCRVMKSFTALPVGVHIQSRGPEDIARNLDFVCVEHPWDPNKGDDHSPEECRDYVKRVIDYSGKPVWAGEWNVNSAGSRSREQARAIATLRGAGCVGIGGPV